MSVYVWADCGPSLEDYPTNPCQSAYTLCVEAEEYDRLRAEVEQYKAVAQMVVDEYYGDESSGDWQTIARAARAALRGGEGG